MSSPNLNGVRWSALDQIDKSRKNALWCLVAAGLTEGILLATVLMLMDFHNRTHLVVFFSACLVYGTLAFGMFALRAYIDFSTLKVLQAVGLLSQPVEDDDAT